MERNAAQRNPARRNPARRNAARPFSPREPIAALATPWGESAIGVIRITGSGCLTLLVKLFRPVAKSADEFLSSPGYTIHKGTIIGGNGPIDEVLIALYKKPKSYTGEDGAEIFCHGGMVIIKSLMDALFEAGFRQANPGEFTMRAFLNGKMDLTRAEAVNEIIRSRTGRAQNIAFSRLTGSIEKRIHRLRKDLLNIRTSMEVHLDYPDEELLEEAVDPDTVAAVRKELQRLVDTYRTGRVFQEGVSLVIAGKTNVGKSTLFNLLLKENRAIVSEIHGTTRDYLEGFITLEGIPIRLFDTAGLRTGGSPLEKEGMNRAESLIEESDMLLYLVDATAEIDEEEAVVLRSYRSKIPVIALWNKVDLLDKHHTPSPDGFLPFSAEKAEGLSALHTDIVDHLLDGAAPAPDDTVIESTRQRDILMKCLKNIDTFMEGRQKGLPLDVLAEDIREAMDNLGEMTGETATAEILEKMFSEFCVGK